jgi:hypothetical protein
LGLIGVFAGGYYLGNEHASQHELEEATMFKELVIDYLDDQGTLLENSNFIFETIDRQKESVAVAGMLRTTEPDRAKVGRFWVELSLQDGKWIPSIVQTKTKSDTYSEDISWP